MPNEISVQVNQVGSTTSQSLVRDHSILIDRPEPKGGHDQGPMGGELLLAALDGCLMSNLLAARDADISDVQLAITGRSMANRPATLPSTCK